MTFGLTSLLLLSVVSTTVDAQEEEAGFAPELTDEKPEVAEIEVNNVPNRVITTFNGDTTSEMGFNWYTTEEIENSKVFISESGDFDDTIEFDAEATQVT